MSKTLSLKMQETVYQETESVIHKMRVPRNAYINTAVHFYNMLQKRAFLKRALAAESQLVRENSMDVLETFEAFEDGLTNSD